MQGRQYGVGVKLAGKQDYLRRSCTGELSQQNDLFRLTYALEMAKICAGLTSCSATGGGQEGTPLS
jgi:hypothetical protein